MWYECDQFFKSSLFYSFSNLQSTKEAIAVHWSKDLSVFITYIIRFDYVIRIGFEVLMLPVVKIISDLLIWQSWSWNLFVLCFPHHYYPYPITQRIKILVHEGKWCWHFLLYNSSVNEHQPFIRRNSNFIVNWKREIYNLFFKGILKNTYFSFC